MQHNTIQFTEGGRTKYESIKWFLSGEPTRCSAVPCNTHYIQEHTRCSAIQYNTIEYTEGGRTKSEPI